jgi:uncharacterized protein (DUF1810 family)
MYNSNILGGFMKRFIEAHEKYYDQAYKEIKKGYKKTHWMWFIFPQLEILGYSETAKYYGIKNKEEALAFLENEYLGNNLIKITKAVLELEEDMINVFGEIDEKKLQSSMTLFYIVSGNKIFKQVLDKFYYQELDLKTVKFLKNKN